MTNKQILLGGTLFYVILAPFFFHPDLKIIYSLAGLLSTGVLNIYARYSAYPQLFSLGPFVYPPAAYFLIGVMFWPVKFLAGSGFTSWLAMGNTAVQVPGIYRFLLAIKLPLIALHLISGWQLTKTVSEKNKKAVASLWFFNPISMYIVALMGQIDGLAVLWIILALVAAKSKPSLGAISLGIGAAVKSFPLLLLPVYIILVAKTWRKRFILTVSGVLAYGVWIIWFLKTPGFYQQALVSGLSKNALTAGIPILLALVTVVVFVKDRGKINKLNNYFLIFALIVLAPIQYHPQWALWALPMAVVYVVEAKNWWWGSIFLVSWLANTFSFSDKFLTFGLLSPIDYSVFYLPNLSIPQIIAKVLMAICLAWITYETIFK